VFEALKALIAGDAAPEPPSPALSTALLLVELARADFNVADEEKRRILELLAARFSLDPEKAMALFDQARRQAGEAVSLHEYIQTLNSTLAPADKGQLIEMLWQVAYADGRIDQYEEHLLRKLAELLYVSQEDYIRAKLKAAGKPV
jgi:uncharacterized tellurite resistance protein B-like protein